jgi:hypothetical protein
MAAATVGDTGNMSRKSRALSASPFRRFNPSPEVIRLVVMMYVRFPLSLRNVEDLLFERGIDICHETVRQCWNRFGPHVCRRHPPAARVAYARVRHSQWHLDEMYVKLNGEMVYLWRAVDHEGEILESYITKARDKDAALRFMKKALKRPTLPMNRSNVLLSCSDGVPPWPGSSIAMTDWTAARSSRTNCQARQLPPRPCISSTGLPTPRIM